MATTLVNTVLGIPISTMELPPTTPAPWMNNLYFNKKVIVTGASSGIGRAVALRLLQSGAQVVLIARRERRLTEVAQAKTNSGVAYCIVADLTDPRQAETAFRTAMTQLRGLDLLVNAAGTVRAVSLVNTGLDEWERQMAINVRAVVQMTSMAVPFLTVSKGAIVNVSAVAGQKAIPGAAAFSVSKSCIDMLTKCSALELAPRGIRVNAVAPGAVSTEARMSPEGNNMTKTQQNTFLAEIASRTPMETAATQWNIADSVLFLGCDESSFITGSVLPVDGGRAITSSGWEQWRQDQMSGVEKLGSKAVSFFRWSATSNV
eukprot:GILI01000422.1.p1 GENE.GILI01000422.1~~GILI01000422.1.p1  ORF type:complete len:318 (-),score=80.63 GILI01000422.1:607-1560(-)